MGTPLCLPIEPYTTGDFRRFGQRIRRRIFLWATHLGDDVAAVAGTSVQAIGAGEVVWSEMRLGSAAKRDWGGVVIIRHEVKREHREGDAQKRLASTTYNLQPTTFYSIYGHITNLTVTVGDRVQPGQQLGVVAAGLTPENGWWQHAHLHFAIYSGPWENRILPGYARPDDWLRPGATRRTRRAWWHDPRHFIAAYNELA